MARLTRRSFLRNGFAGMSALGTSTLWGNLVLTGCSHTPGRELLPADDNGIRLLPGMRSRVVAKSSQPVIENSGFLWHAAPDGGACFATVDGGWIYVSNSEIMDTGGVGAIVFDAQGNKIDAYAILTGTSRNCAGGAMPWGHWLSCEEYDQGRVWECDPKGLAVAEVRPALGVFSHEAVAADTLNHQLYLTEDKPDGCLYRYLPDAISETGVYDLVNGQLQLAVVNFDTGAVSWADVPDPLASSKETRYQLAEASAFNGGEGIVYFDGKVIFTTKGDNRVWQLDVARQRLTILYDAADYASPVLTGVDNVTVSPRGEIYVAEDGGDMQIVVIEPSGKLFPALQVEGQPASEITGPAFSPDGKRLYFSSQRGVQGVSDAGITYEISGF
jgi:uncharacterized protein